MKFKINRKRVFTFTWIFCGSLLAILQLTQKNSLDFVGIVGLRSQEISTTSDVRVKKIYVFAGQDIKKGDPIIEFENPQLELEIHRVSAELAQLIEQKKFFNTIIDTEEYEFSNIAALKKQLSLLENEKRQLFIFSKFNGKIESLLKKEGEIAQAHIPTITLLEEVPTLVRGYIHESILEDITIGTNVLVANPNSTQKKYTQGKVISIGSSIMPFPDRLLKDPNRQVWGREALIEIPSNNQLLIGEKVSIIKKESEFILLEDANAYEDKVNKSMSSSSNALTLIPLVQIQKFDLVVPGQSRFESSGVVFIPELNQYLIIGDGRSNSKNTQIIYADSQSEYIIDARVQGIEGLDDFESISLDENENIYILSSLNEEDHELVKLSREGMNIVKTHSVLLRKILKEYISAHPKEESLSNLMKNGEVDVDIEGSFVKNDSLFFGLRSTKDKKGRALIYQLEGLESLFNHQEIKRLSLYKSVYLNSKNDKNFGISDLAQCDGALYIAAAPVNKDERTGAIFRLNGNSSDPELLITYPKSKPEGINCHSQNSKLSVVFDHGKQASFAIIYEIKN